MDNKRAVRDAPRVAWALIQWAYAAIVILFLMYGLLRMLDVI